MLTQNAPESGMLWGPGYLYMLELMGAKCPSDKLRVSVLQLIDWGNVLVLDILLHS